MNKTMAFLLLILILTACAPKVTRPEKMVLYKSPQCGCCTEYAKIMQQQGFAVETIVLDDIAPIKEKYKIPDSMLSCHTSVVEEYFVEGHVPIEAIDKLLSERPKIDGIAMPGMPLGSPGMPGKKTEPFIIYALTDGSVTEYMTI